MTRIRILVPVGHVAGRDPAFERGLALAQASGAELHLIHAVPAHLPFSSHAVQRLQRWAELRTRAEAAGLTVHTTEQHGDPADIIVLHADVRNVDLIVMASGRRTGWARLRQPSVAERVVRRTTRPTLVVSPDDPVATAFRNVLVAVKLSPTCNTVVDLAMRLSEPDARRLTILHAVERVEGPAAVRSLARWVVPEYRGYVFDDARRRLEAMMEGIDVDDPTAQLRVAPGPAADTIVDHAADVDADLIVVGRSERMMRWGSTATRVLRHSDRAVLIVPQTASRLFDTNQPSVRRAA